MRVRMEKGKMADRVLPHEGRQDGGQGPIRWRRKAKWWMGSYHMEEWEGSWEDGVRTGSGERGLGNMVPAQEVKDPKEEGSEWGRANWGKCKVEVREVLGQGQGPSVQQGCPHRGKKEEQRE